MSEGAAAGHPAPPAGAVRRSPGELALWSVLATGVTLSLLTAVSGRQPVAVLAIFVVPLVLVAFQRWLLAWQTLLALILLVILFIPIRRYTVGEELPIALEPYRVVIAVVLACWAFALAADPAVRWRPTGFGAPIAAIWLAILASLALNVGRVSAAGDFVVKAVTFFGSYFLLLCFIASVIKPGRQLDRMIRLLVLGGGVLACFALYEWRSGFNAFNGLGSILPFLTYEDIGTHIVRGTGVRALASAQHSIALGAALVMLIPLAVYLFKRSGKVGWLAIGGILSLGALATGSRTATMMLMVLFVVFLWLQRAQVLRLLPYLVVLFVVVQGVMPGTLGTFRVILDPVYVIQEQSKGEGTGAGRIADLAPSLRAHSRSPFVGQGFGTRITSEAGPIGGARILDNQWLGTLLEIGALGVIGLLWLFGRAIGRLARRARSDPGPDGWLATALAGALAAYAAGMVTFDAFAFIQVTFLAFIMFGFAALATREEPAPPVREQGAESPPSRPRPAGPVRA
ncbi:MAG TPA: O-antigen ligase family protein [Solirubrobacteraceae bacterium]|nr:O-antigen ligase family protein [Solirubrobacteraceae bacterium]